MNSRYKTDAVCHDPRPLSICPDPEKHRIDVSLRPLPIACPTCWSGQRCTSQRNAYAAYYKEVHKRWRRKGGDGSQAEYRRLQKYSKLWKKTANVSAVQFKKLLRDSEECDETANEQLGKQRQPTDTASVRRAEERGTTSTIATEDAPSTSSTLQICHEETENGEEMVDVESVDEEDKAINSDAKRNQSVNEVGQQLQHIPCVTSGLEEIAAAESQNLGRRAGSEGPRLLDVIRWWTETQHQRVK